MPTMTRNPASPSASHQRKARRLEILVHDRRWLRALPNAAALLKGAAKTAFRTVKSRPSPGFFTLVLVSDAEMRSLNRIFRGRGKPTNVLSFQGLDGEESDIILAFETCRREARDQGKPLADHARHLLVHGILHALGHDHEQPAAARKMEALETKILKSLRIPDPYMPRSKGRG